MEELLELLTKYWTLVVTLIGLVVSYTKVNTSVKELRHRVTNMEKEIKEMNPIWQEIKERLARIETSLQIHFKDK
jgi:chaperonin cofactor prefoldin